MYGDEEIRQLIRPTQICYKLINQKASLGCGLRKVLMSIFADLENYPEKTTAKSMILILENLPFPEKLRGMRKIRIYLFSHQMKSSGGERNARQNCNVGKCGSNDWK